MIINFPVSVGDTVYVINDRSSDCYLVGDESPFVVCEETVAYLAIGKDNEIFVFTQEDGCVPKSINNDIDGVFTCPEYCEKFCCKESCM